MMLAQNNDTGAAISAIKSLEDKFNRWFHYPVVFLNDEVWEEQFVEALSAVTSGETHFETVGKEAWGFPAWIDPEQARKSMKKQEMKGILRGGKEGYHHMCRFYSG